MHSNEKINNGISGSVTIANNALKYLASEVTNSKLKERSAFFLDLSKKTEKVCKKYWYMASINNQLKHVIREARVKTRAEKDIELIKKVTLEQIQITTDDFEENINKAAKNAAKLFYPENSIFVFSQSYTIIRALEIYKEHRGPDLNIHTVEAKPGSEGILFADTCAKMGYSVHLYPDMNITNAVANSDAVVIGADRLLCREFFNKAGTCIVLEYGKKFGKQNIIVCDQSKILKLSDFMVGQLKAKPDETLRPKGKLKYNVTSYYFERGTYDNITRITTELGNFEFEDFRIRYLE